MKSFGVQVVPFGFQCVILSVGRLRSICREIFDVSNFIHHQSSCSCRRFIVAYVKA
jgi:hypothetical protein